MKTISRLGFKNTEQVKALGVNIYEAQEYSQGFLCALVVYHLVDPGHKAKYEIKE